MAKTAADILIERLIKWDVEVIFGLPGDCIKGIMESLRTRQEQIRFIQVRHEEAAAFMVCSYAKYTGKLGVCLATSNRSHVESRIAYKVQEEAFGGLAVATRERLEAIGAKHSRIKLRAKPREFNFAPGSCYCANGVSVNIA